MWTVPGGGAVLSYLGSGGLTRGRRSLTHRLSRLVPGLAEAGRVPGGSAGLGAAAAGAEAGSGHGGHHQDGEGAAAGAGEAGLLQGEGGHEPDARHPALPGLAAGRGGPLPPHLGQNRRCCPSKSVRTGLPVGVADDPSCSSFLRPFSQTTPSKSPTVL